MDMALGFQCRPALKDHSQKEFTCSLSTSRYSGEYWSSRARAVATKYGISFKANITGPAGLYNSGLIIGVVQKQGTHSDGCYGRYRRCCPGFEVKTTYNLNFAGGQLGPPDCVCKYFS
jgi:hypothetical protein